jgi:hypothetical protein
MQPAVSVSLPGEQEPCLVLPVALQQYRFTFRRSPGLQLRDSGGINGP